MGGICNICKEEPITECVTPCNHTYCHLCIHLHLLNQENCPTCDFKPVLSSNLIFDSTINFREKLEKPFFPLMNLSKLKIHCKKLRIIQKGTRKELINRLNKYYTIFDSERYRKNPDSIDKIIRRSNNFGNFGEINRKLTGKQKISEIKSALLKLKNQIDKDCNKK